MEFPVAEVPSGGGGGAGAVGNIPTRLQLAVRVV